MNSWNIADFRPIEKGTLRGFFTLQIGPARFHGFSLHLKEETGAKWIGMPQREYQENGERKFDPTVEFTSKERRWNFQKLALAELKILLPNTTDQAHK